jgi:hypothetical protein
MSIFPGPTPPFTNPVIDPDAFQPSQFFISAITLGKTTTVTTTVNNNYVIGQLCRLLIPAQYGSIQLNEVQGYVTSIPALSQVVLSIDSSRNVDAFISSPAYGPTLPQIVAIGDVNTGQINSNGSQNTLTYIPGSFINISP